jgi:small-conductance mechanosensitive channel
MNGPGAAVRSRAVIGVVALIGACLAPGPAAAPASAQPLDQHPAAASARVLAIPVPEIAQRGEDVAARLRQSAERLATDPRVRDVESRLPEASDWLDARLVTTTQALDAGPSPSTLDGLTDSWMLLRARLVEWNQTLTRRATELEQELRELEALRATWSVSRDEALASGAPAPVVDRINATLAAVVSARDIVVDGRTRVLRLQDRVVKEAARCDDVLSRISRIRRNVVAPLFTRDSRPIWSPEALTLARTDVGPRLRRSLADTLELAQEYFAGQLARVPFQVALFVLVVVVVGRARAGARRQPGREPDTPAVEVVDAPVSSALALSLLATWWIYPRVPHAVASAVGLVILLPVVAIVRRLAPRPALPAVYAIAAFFVIDRAREVCAVVPVLEQWMLLFELLFGAGFLAFTLRSRCVAELRGGAGSGWRRALPWILWGQLVVLVAASFAAAVGAMQLARLLGIVVVSSDYTGLVLYAGVRVGEGLVAYALRVRPLAALRMVQRQRGLLQRRLCRGLAWLAAATWAFFTLDALRATGPIGSTAAAVLSARYIRGSVNLSAGDVLAFGATIVGAILVSSFVRFVLHEEVYPRTETPHGVSYALSTLLHYALILGGLLLAVSSLGVDLTRVTILAGAFGVGIGIGLQNVVANFVAGLVLLLEHRIHVGDSIEAGDLRGEVREIGFRASTVRTWTGAEVIVPNDRLTGDRVTNWTLSDRRSRVDVKLTVSYAADPQEVLQVLRRIGEAQPRALPEPAPLAMCTGFRDDGLQLELRVWTGRVEEAELLRSELTIAVHAALAAAGIEIALPRHVLSIREDGAPPDALVPLRAAHGASR